MGAEKLNSENQTVRQTKVKRYQANATQWLMQSDMNAMAKKGWRVVSTTGYKDSHRDILTGKHENYITVFFEREIAWSQVRAEAIESAKRVKRGIKITLGVIVSILIYTHFNTFIESLNSKETPGSSPEISHVAQPMPPPFVKNTNSNESSIKNLNLGELPFETTEAQIASKVLAEYQKSHPIIITVNWSTTKEGKRWTENLFFNFKEETMTITGTIPMNDQPSLEVKKTLKGNLLKRIEKAKSGSDTQYLFPSDPGNG